MGGALEAPPSAVMPFVSDTALDLTADLLLKQNSRFLGLKVGGEVVGMNNAKFHGVSSLLWAFASLMILLYHEQIRMSTPF